MQQCAPWHVRRRAPAVEGTCSAPRQLPRTDDVRAQHGTREDAASRRPTQGGVGRAEQSRGAAAHRCDGGALLRFERLVGPAALRRGRHHRSPHRDCHPVLPAAVLPALGWRFPATGPAPHSRCIPTAGDPGRGRTGCRVIIGPTGVFACTWGISPQRVTQRKTRYVKKCANEMRPVMSQQ